MNIKTRSSRVAKCKKLLLRKPGEWRKWVFPVTASDRPDWCSYWERVALSELMGCKPGDLEGANRDSLPFEAMTIASSTNKPVIIVRYIGNNKEVVA